MPVAFRTSEPGSIGQATTDKLTNPRNDLLMAAPVGGVVFLLASGGSG
jgi:hypothetical protein